VLPPVIAVGAVTPPAIGVGMTAVAACPMGVGVANIVDAGVVWSVGCGSVATLLDTVKVVSDWAVSATRRPPLARITDAPTSTISTAVTMRIKMEL